MIIYTDGSYHPLENTGGFAVVLVDENRAYYGPVKLLELSSPKAELYAIFCALSMTDEVSITIHSDSEYSINCLTKWYDKWEKKNGAGVKNWFLIKACHDLMINRDVRFTHVRAHQGNHNNEIADQLANMGRLETDTQEYLFDI